MAITWQVLDHIEQIATLLEHSHRVPVVIFKHSTRCGISLDVKERLETTWQSDQKIDMYYLDLLAYRAVSNQIADKLGVMHQSPQIILLWQGKVLYHASHQAVSAANLLRNLEKNLLV